MPTSRKHEYNAAMQTLSEICAEHNIRVNEKLREVFWEGVQHGWRRAIARTKEKPAVAPERTTRIAKSADRPVSESGVDGVTGSDAGQKRARDLSRAGLFRL